ncbi:TVP38/TMEM64 family protein [Candidatus Pelagibacter sp.]|uniref:TVP38/TMEM64 family protein n=1 Tax=Candidatus Pelagibacter sp. TaxID=2024849 RepID=UPI003F84D23E
MMEKAKKTKIIIGLSYLVLLTIFVLLFFSKFSIQEITSYDFIKENRLYFLKLKNSNLFLISIIFLIFTILWVFPFLGFGSPIALLGGFIFGKWLGTIIVVIGMSVGATFLYIFGNYFLKDLIRDKFLNRYQNLERKFKKSEFYYLLIYRFIGGIPWQLSCILPTIFDVRVKNFFFASLIGIIPQIFLAVSLGSGLEKVIEQNSQVPKITDIIFSSEIYIPILAFFSLVLITIFLRKSFYKN